MGTFNVDVVFRIEKQEVIKLDANATQEMIAENTREILSKIEKINKNQGLKFSTTLRPNARSMEERKYEDNSPQKSPLNNPFFDSFQFKNENKNKQISNDNDYIPGQFIKRKITHQQTYITPGYPQPLFFPPYALPPPLENPPLTNTQQKSNKNKTTDFLESQTIDNIKNIIINSHVYPVQTIPPNFNPYSSVLPWTMEQHYKDNTPQYRQQINWPWSAFFPIIIKDPIVHMLNAVTSMVEYGPTATCPTGKAEEERGLKSLSDNSEINYNVKNLGTKPEITIFGGQSTGSSPEGSGKVTMLDIEDLKITGNDEEPVKFTMNFKSPVYEFASTERQPKITKGETKRVIVKKGEAKQDSPPNRDQELDPEELESEAEEIALETTISKDDGTSHNNNKKFFSKDNTGSGIFIHKIKVRKGGVAIAGPGGIATAGSGGTAIVGPNGFAYTHPDSLAIAGSGSKVVAIDPSVNLADVVNAQNKTRKDGSTPRSGRVVAVGPVIYYNRGK